MKVLTNNQYYKDIADTIRQMKGVATTYKPREMASALRDMYSTEVEGVPPLTFPSNGNNLLNYRIDGANGGVGDRTANLLDYNWLFDYEQKRVNEYFNYIQITLEPNTTYNVTSDYDYNQAQNATAFIVVNSNTAITTANGGVFGSLTVTTTQDGILKIARRIKGNNETMIPKREDFENNSKHIQISINSVNDDNYEPYGYKIPVVISGKNLVNKNNMLQGYWAYANGSFISVNTWICTPKIECLGNTTYTYQFSNASRWSGFVFYDKNGNYISTSNIQNSSSTEYRTYTATSPSNARYLVVNIAGFPGTEATISVSDLINFQLEQNNEVTNYEPYIEPTTTNIYLDEPIEVNESKELSDTNVNIPTINGTNILSVNTTVQPSKVYVQAPKSISGGDYNIKVDTSNNISDNWYGLLAYIVEIGNIDTSNIIDMTNMFSGSQITEIPLLNTQNVTNMSNMFYGCQMITEIPLLNTQNVTDMGGMFEYCSALTNESLNNVLKMCIDAVNIASSYKTLYYIGLSQAQATTCATLSNYQDFLNAGWTTGY